MRPYATMHSLPASLLTSYAAILCDLDGCLISGDHVYPGVREFASLNCERLWIVSNNSSDTAVTLSLRLAALDLAIAPERIVLAGEQAVRRLAAERPGAKVAIHAEPPIQALAEELGLVESAHLPEWVLLARDTRLNLPRLTAVLAQIEAGAALFVTNLDTAHPDPEGLPVPETGALLAALRACKTDLSFRSIGKPAPDLIEIALGRAGAVPGEAVFIGDNVTTDGEAARVAGVDFIHLRSSHLALSRLPLGEEKPAVLDGARRAAC